MHHIIALAVLASVTSAAKNVCGTAGYDKESPQAYKSTTKATLSACSSLCTSEKKCKGYAFGQKECLLYTSSVANNVDADPDSPYSFYDVGCAVTSGAATTLATTTRASSTTSTPTPTPTPVKTTNLLKDGDFETGAWGAGWSNIFGDSLDVVQPGKSGSYAGKLPESVWLEYSSLSLTPGALYTFSADFKTDDSACEITVSTQRDGIVDASWRTTSLTSGKWTSLSGSFIATGTEKLDLITFCNSDSYVDNMVLVQASSTAYDPSTVKVGTNIVKDAGFESGSTSSYTLEGGVVPTVVAKAGKDSTKGLVASFGAVSSGGNAIMTVTQKLTVTKGSLYRLSLDAMLNANIPSGCTVSYWLGATNSIHSYGSDVAGSELIANTWKHYSAIVVANIASSQVVLYAHCSGNSSPVKLTVDNFTLEPLA